MKLIDNWKEAWQFASVKIALAVAALPLLEPYLPELQPHLSPAMYSGLAIAIILARVIQFKPSISKH